MAKINEWVSVNEYCQEKNIENKNYFRARVSHFTSKEPMREIEVNGKKCNAWTYSGALIRKSFKTILCKDI